VVEEQKAEAERQIDYDRLEALKLEGRADLRQGYLFL